MCEREREWGDSERRERGDISTTKRVKNKFKNKKIVCFFLSRTFFLWKAIVGMTFVFFGQLDPLMKNN